MQKTNICQVELVPEIASHWVPTDQLDIYYHNGVRFTKLDKSLWMGTKDDTGKITIRFTPVLNTSEIKINCNYDDLDYLQLTVDRSEFYNNTEKLVAVYQKFVSRTETYGYGMTGWGTEGTALEITDENSNNVVERDFALFGERLKQSETDRGASDEDDSAFTGKDWDIDAGLYYYNARWYDPEIGRFTSEDSVADDPNLYGYCFNNPVNNIDPTGHFSMGDLGAFATIISAAAIITGDEKLGTLAGAMGLFISVYSLCNKPEKVEADTDAAKNNVPIEDPVKPGDDSNGAGTGNPNEPPKENSPENDAKKQAILDETGPLFEKLDTLQAGTPEYKAVLKQIQENMDLVYVLEGKVPENISLNVDMSSMWKPSGLGGPLQFINPTKIKKLNQVYGKRKRPRPDATKDHKGWDEGNDLNTEILASAGGTVIFIDFVGKAKVVTIDHGNGLQTHYWHLNGFADIKQWDVIGQGTVIGYMGNTGVSTGVHLHFAISRGKLNNGKWNYIDPAQFITLDPGLTTATDVYYKNGAYHNKLPKK